MVGGGCVVVVVFICIGGFCGKQCMHDEDSIAKNNYN